MMYNNEYKQDLNPNPEKDDNNTFEYNSSMGKLSWQQERVLLFGKSTHYLILTIFAAIAVINLIYGLYNLYFSSEYITTLTGTSSASIILKIFGTITTILVILVPIGAIRIRIGAMKHDPFRTVRGLEMVQLYNNISMILLVIGAAFAGITMVFSLFVNFVVSLFFIVLMGGIIYFMYNYIRKCIDVCENLILYLQVKAITNKIPIS